MADAMEVETDIKQNHHKSKQNSLSKGNNGELPSGESNGPSHQSEQSIENPFTLKKWNLVGMWSWDVECDTCAICRVHVMDSCLRCQNDYRADDCVVVWGECNHVFHNCCMSNWVKLNNRCPLCAKEWLVKRIGK